jgi:hypothetical protein
MRGELLEAGEVTTFTLVDGLDGGVLGTEDATEFVLDGEEMSAAPATPSRQSAKDAMEGGEIGQAEVLDGEPGVELLDALAALLVGDTYDEGTRVGGDANANGGI